MHLSENFFPDARAYKPGRFAGDPAPAAFMPFGAGPRVCLGLNMALTEGTLALAEIFNRVSLKMVRDLEGEVILGFTMRPKGKLELEVAPRKP
jgi:cytochrome P450